MQRTVRTRAIGTVIVGLLLAFGLAPGLGPASAATQTVTITGNGYVPTAVTITVGDAVSFANSDGKPHEVQVKPTTGVTCTASPLVVAVGRAQSCTFASAGTYSLSDPAGKGRTYKGTITVKAAPEVGLTLVPARTLVVYGSSLVFTGKVTPARAGVTVDVQAMPYGKGAFATVAPSVTGADGGYAVEVKPKKYTIYRAQYVDAGRTVQSAQVRIDVRPRVGLSLVALAGGRATFTTSAKSTVSYAGKPLLVQRYSPTAGWTTVMTVKLGSTGTARFKASLPRGESRWRTVLQTAYAGPGYVAGSSRVVTVTR